MANTVKNSLSNTKTNHQNMSFGIRIAQNKKIIVFRNSIAQRWIGDWYLVGDCLYFVLEYVAPTMLGV